MGKKDFRMYENLALLSQVGFIMIVPIAGGLFVGKWLDGLFGTSPLFLLALIILGTLSAFVSLFKFTMAASKKDKRK
ncbi:MULTISPECIES: AtpZ/AtpI family protein [unclassified Fusibacter]|uniref:AtpZ/AtpI family protein n=1 Tax=unclassified Fusibacter TaxID=2624464 RepID=UPI0010103558|nr:AtpZ/AtpI family protein [Fusibacter sp. A1]MCK8059867.1 AtpZ/AtpI family protein [Fusibacter sp. A2]NPE21669.1 AtpZ/AtpI family protein [Fusibacter sp. A1]RXV62073.1 F0F1 ATP synthase subunit [Fusibacter sp. A1]